MLDECEYIIIYPNDFIKNDIIVKSENTLFLDRVAIEITPEYISFKRVGIDYNGKTYKLFKKRKNYYNTSLTLLDRLEYQKLFFDKEDSDEDFLIAYFETV